MQAIPPTDIDLEGRGTTTTFSGLVSTMRTETLSGT